VLIPTRLLNNGHRIPQIGLGTWPLTDDEAEAVVATAIATGYRHIDTAVRYGNERGVGRGLRASSVPREELFVTTKLDGPFQGEERAVAVSMTASSAWSWSTSTCCSSTGPYPSTVNMSLPGGLSSACASPARPAQSASQTLSPRTLTGYAPRQASPLPSTRSSSTLVPRAPSTVPTTRPTVS